MCLAEFIGTAVLVFMGCGSAVFLGTASSGGHLAVALAFGLSLMVMIYAIGNVSGCHINPAVTFAAFMDNRINGMTFCVYIISQLSGGIAGAALLKLLSDMVGIDRTGALGANLAAGAGGTGGTFIIEGILTFIFILTLLNVTIDSSKSSVIGIILGMTLTLVHIVGIPLTGTSVNPARSIGPAIFAGGQALNDLWIFIVAPLAGAVLATLIYKGLKFRR